MTVATAAPAPADPATTAPAAPVGVHYNARIDGNTVVATLDDGATFAVDGDVVSVRDSEGRVLQSVPLSYTFDEQQRGIAHEISDAGSTLRLTPDTAGLVVRTGERPELSPVASPLEDQLAMNDLINSASIGLTIGSLIGTIIGTVLGIGVGFVMAGAACLVISLACVVTVLPIMALVAGVGGIIGLDIGGATVIPAVLNYIDTVNAPPGTSKYASQIPAFAGTEPGAPIQPEPAP
ncbi:hypothetical protein [Nocardia neocaledoniensis]|uniref:hypothetical protein n=1 Tax=Nocardia neocaledoniensis TaxID=236511 RepID=UPI002458BD75|nr:hypothetical protein [Nocardia neocaledoniensis]